MTTVKVPAPGISTISFDQREVAILSGGILEYCEGHDLEVSDAVLALSLSLGKLLAPEEMTEEEEFQFLDWILNQVGLYFAEGEVH